jgi:hypothetical protein
MDVKMEFLAAKAKYKEAQAKVDEAIKRLGELERKGEDLTEIIDELDRLEEEEDHIYYLVYEPAEHRFLTSMLDQVELPPRYKEQLRRLVNREGFFTSDQINKLIEILLQY